MKVMIALENRFYKVSSGEIFSNNIFDYSIWQRYLQVFDEVIIFARVGEAKRDISGKQPASGKGVSFFELPMYVGFKQYVSKYHQLKRSAKKAVDSADAFLLRIPGRISTHLWHELMKRNIPYGVEVVGSSADSLQTCGIPPLGRWLLQNVLPEAQRKQCLHAAVSAYVSKEYLQRQCPPGGWSTYYSSIDLPPEAILTQEQIVSKRNYLQEAIEGKRPFRLCHAGTMAAKYKGQDILIEAAGRCLREGLNLEVVLMGDGQFRPFYEQKAAAMGIAERVRFLGSVPPGQAVRDEYDRADMLVFPSLTEGLPRVPIEAMARGLICIGSKVGGIPELLENKHLVEPGNSRQLAEKIQQVLRDPIELVDQVEKSVQKASEYALEKVNMRRIECYQKLVQVTEEYQKRKFLNEQKFSKKPKNTLGSNSL